MKNITNLRRLRGRCRMSLRELAAASGLSRQYISRAELREIPATRALEAKLSSAVKAVIASRQEELLALEAAYWAYQGRLLETAEEEEP